MYEFIYYWDLLVNWVLYLISSAWAGFRSKPMSNQLMQRLAQQNNTHEILAKSDEINTDVGFFDVFVLGFSYFDLVLIVVILLGILICTTSACCLRGSKKPPVEYKDIIGKFGDEDEIDGLDE